MANAPISVRYADGSERPLERIVANPIYSTAEMLSGFTASEVPLFNYAQGEDITPVAPGGVTIGGLTRQSTYRDTNLETKGQLPERQAFQCMGCSIETFNFIVDSAVTPTTYTSPIGGSLPFAALLTTLHERLSLSVKVSEREYIRAGYGFQNQGFGPQVVQSAAGTSAIPATRSMALGGVPSDEAVNVFRPGFTIGGTETLDVKFERGANVPATDGAVNFFNDQGAQDDVLLARSIVYLRGVQLLTAG